MTSGTQRRTPASDPAFSMKSELMSAEDVGRVMRRMAHEIVERNKSLEDVSLIGLQSGGRPFAEAFGTLLSEIGGLRVPVGMLDVSFYRDDVGRAPLAVTSPTTIDHDLTNRTVIIVDDVLYTGRTVRAALNALSDFGRPRMVQLAVMVDRGHRELPIRADVVGKNLPTSHEESVMATLEGVWIGERRSS